MNLFTCGEKALWPASLLGEAIEELASRGKLLQRPLGVRVGSETNALQPGEDAGTWIQAESEALGLEAEPTRVLYGEVADLVKKAGPALVELDVGCEARFVAILRCSRRTVSIVCTDLVTRRIAAELLQRVICRPLEGPLIAEIEATLDAAGVTARTRRRARLALLHHRLRRACIGGCWLLRPSPNDGFWRGVRRAHLLGCAVSLVLLHATQCLLWVLSWWAMGRGALAGRVERELVLAWGLLVLSLIPLRLLSTWLQGRFQLSAGCIFKQRLMWGALRSQPEEICQYGVGHLFGRMLDSQAVETRALGGGLRSSMAAVELTMAAAVLNAGAGGRAHCLLLVGWIVLTVVLARRYLELRRRWTQARLELTHCLVEETLGYRTRLVQESRRERHVAEDRLLQRYLRLSRRLDQGAAALLALPPRGWLVVGLLGLTPAFVASTATPGSMAVGLGGLLLSYSALGSLVGGLSQLAAALISWQQVSALSPAEAHGEPPAAHRPRRLRGPASLQGQERIPIVQAKELVFSYPQHKTPVVDGVDLTVLQGDRVLVVGPSGGGKSTLMALLAGLRKPDSGVLLLNGLDVHALGISQWRQQIVAVPQFHDNYVFNNTLAFNLLMGRRWPPTEEDLREARRICQELGLETLLEKMPCGLFQMVGESGWQLSHGERSRLFIARALLQEPELILLDESFAALDPENVRRSLDCVRRRAPTLVVVAHP